MIRVHALVEGQTEETFVRDVLAPHLQAAAIHYTPIILATKIVKTGGKFRGGISSYAKVQKELRNLLGDTSAAKVTTMLDYYGLKEAPDFPGLETLPAGASCWERVDHLERAFAADVDHPRFLPYLSLHEFEALVLTDPYEVQKSFPQRPVADPLSVALAAVDSPEEIDDGAKTHPAARIVRHAPSYRKALHGPTIVQRIGLERLRRSCPHFDDWVDALERLAPGIE